MRIRKIFIVTVLTGLLLAGLIFTGCGTRNASGDFHGRWVTSFGDILEFTGARFTRTMPGGEVRRGTFTTDEGFISFHRSGYTTEIMSYEIDFPRLVLNWPGHSGATTYFHDSPGEPTDLEGWWIGFAGELSHLWFVPIHISQARPQRGNPNVLEGYINYSTIYKGKYTISARNLPYRGVLREEITHTHGGSLFQFLHNRTLVPPHIYDLFDWRLLQTLEDPSYWWYTLDEARRFFMDAAERARSEESAGRGVALEQHVINLMNIYQGGVLVGRNLTTEYDFTLEVFEERRTVYDRIGGNAISGYEFLTLRTSEGRIATFVRQNEGWDR